MNEYLSALNAQRPRTWRHQPVQISLSQSTVTFRVGTRRWDVSLGGTDSLYYLMAYHYALLTLIKHEQAHFPGLVMIDFPAEFAGTKIGDSEDFVVQPFIDLLEYRSLRALPGDCHRTSFLRPQGRQPDRAQTALYHLTTG